MSHTCLLAGCVAAIPNTVYVHGVLLPPPFSITPQGVLLPPLVYRGVHPMTLVQFTAKQMCGSLVYLFTSEKSVKGDFVLSK